MYEEASANIAEVKRLYSGIFPFCLSDYISSLAAFGFLLPFSVKAYSRLFLALSLELHVSLHFYFHTFFLFSFNRLFYL